MLPVFDFAAYICYNFGVRIGKLEVIFSIIFLSMSSAFFRNETDEERSSSYSSKGYQESKLPPQSQVVFGLILVVGLAAIVFGAIGIGQVLKSPFSNSQQANISLDINAFALSNTTVDTSNLRNKDTDNDGLNDYDELYIHRTSPYLTDSDSDSTNDKDEVSAGKDPNCPEGQNCFRPSVNTNAGTTVAPTDTVTLDQLREALRNAGAPENIIQGLTDAELLEVYNDIVVEQGGEPVTLNEATNSGSTNTDNLNSLSPTTVNVNDLQTLSADQIRSFLIASGVDSKIVEQVDNEALQLIFQQALAEQTGSQ
ncbi:MAG: hypothetical protein V1685_03775 [Parcubacteria group bacterium]